MYLQTTWIFPGFGMLQLTIRGDNHHNHHNHHTVTGWWWLVGEYIGCNHMKIWNLQPKGKYLRHVISYLEVGWWFQTLSRAFGVENHPSVQPFRFWVLLTAKLGPDPCSKQNLDVKFSTVSIHFRCLQPTNHSSIHESTNYIAAYYLLRNLIQRYTISPNNSQTLIYKWYIFP